MTGIILIMACRETVCTEADSVQGVIINCSNKIQTKANGRDQTRGEDLQLGDLKVLKELPRQSGERIL